MSPEAGGRTVRGWPRLWWAPLLLLLAPPLGRVPAALDIPGFFAPMRGATAAMVTAGSLPWLNPSNGCGEPWFANPETGVLYPPHGLYAILPPAWALSAEVALHLAWLSLGTGLLAVRWGGGRRGRTVVEVAAWSCGPTLSTVGVVNNLDALAWLPWIVLAARAGARWAVPAVAATVAMGWLAGEPQVWALALVMAVVASPDRRRTVLGVLLGLALVAVQVGPFVAWVAEGDRGSGLGQHALAGAVTPQGWAGLVLPGVAIAGPGERLWAASLFLGVPLLLTLALGSRQRWRLALPPLIFAALSTLPEVGGDELYLGLTRALVRYPSRFAVVALLCLLPLAGPGAERWLDGGGRRLAWLLAGATLLLTPLAPSPTALLAGGVPAVVLALAALSRAGTVLRVLALAAGAVAAVVVSWPLLGLSPVDEVVDPPCPWPEATDGRRLFAPSPDVAGARWIAERAEHGRLWASGYANLSTGLSTAHSPAPVRHRDLAEHLRRADGGERWWLATLAAPWVVLPTAAAPAGMVATSERSGLWLFHDRRAWSTVTLSAQRPAPDASWKGVGATLVLERRSARLRIGVISDQPGWLCLSIAPLRGWRWSLNGGRVVVERYAGILHGLRLPAGVHRLEGRYRPPLIVTGAWVSGGAVVVLVALLAGGCRRRLVRQADRVAAVPAASR